MTEVYIGFDSAWTDNIKAPGAICSLTLRADEIIFDPPRLARFEQAAEFIEDAARTEDFLVVALDQPTRVPNASGARPVERVAGSVVNRLKGGVQPARREGGGAVMFGDDAPVWRFLARLDALEDPMLARQATEGRFLMEVFPALALPSLIPKIWTRKLAAKYNPAASHYQPADWPLVCNGAADFAEGLNVQPVAEWLRDAAIETRPTKGLQDRLDSVLCLIIAVHWRRGPSNASIVIGDLQTGYMVTPVIPAVREVLERSAAERGVPVGGHGQPSRLKPPMTPVTIPRPSSPPRVAVPQPAFRASSEAATTTSYRLPAEELRALLIPLAVAGQTISYGEVAKRVGQPWSRAFSSTLMRALKEVDRINKSAGEPSLMSLVVNRETGLPGGGFFDQIEETAASAAARRAVHNLMRDKCRNHHWLADRHSVQL